MMDNCVDYRKKKKKNLPNAPLIRDCSYSIRAVLSQHDTKIKFRRSQKTQHDTKIKFRRNQKTVNTFSVVSVGAVHSQHGSD
mgnify:CR=1 FL=1